MALSAGTRLGPYEILEPLGAGGMGEVYRARDTRLDRTVAVKVLPGGFAADPQLKARFHREARAISALAHPNICTLHDVGEEDGQIFLVMEHLVGQTLAERLRKGRLPVDQAVEIAAQTADALATAHKEGVVHRDLKPSNVMLTKTGARLLDFGLARLTHGERPAVDAQSAAPTEQAPLTGEGRIVGTLPYMAPEQVEGKPADARTDLWALGTILYEMVTGERAFEGTTPPSLVAAILEREPAPLTERQPLTPPSLERLVRRCLAKDPDDRWDTAHDVAVRLREIAEGDHTAGDRATAKTRRSVLLAALVAAFSTGAALVALWANTRPSVPPARVKRLTVQLPPNAPMYLRSFMPALALSPDGTRLAYVGRDGDTRQLYLRSLDEYEPSPIPGTFDARGPFFSPDGTSLGFFANRRLKTVVLPSGPVSEIADAPNAFGGSWGPEGNIVFMPSASLSGVLQVPAQGGSTRVLTTVDLEKGEDAHFHPEILPDGRAILFTVELAGRHHVEVLSLDSGQRRVLIREGIGAKYVPTGHIVYRMRGRLEAVPFDLETLQVTGPPATLLEDLAATTATTDVAGAPQLTFSRDGSLAYVPEVSFPFGRRLVWVDRSGGSRPLGAPEKAYSRAALSPDGRRLAVQIVAPNDDIWVYDLGRHTLTRLTFEGENWGPVWTPDGRRISFVSTRGGRANLFWAPADGSGQAERLTRGDRRPGQSSWSPDGRMLAFTESSPSTRADIRLLDVESGEVQTFLDTPFFETQPAFSPDGRWVAYTSDESGRPEVYVQPFPGPGAKRQVSTEGGENPAWAVSGKELFYTAGQRLMAAAIRTEPTFSCDRPRVLFEEPLRDRLTFQGVAPDEGHFLMIERPTAELDRPQFNLVLNWSSELERLSPTGR